MAPTRRCSEQYWLRRERYALLGERVDGIRLRILPRVHLDLGEVW